ncbi:hemerythrin domain-containing protein [Clostridium weizhouense]|uniref:hemerythrin domain-containing protein n=1 Tax=Clostridium weizhouense TaxID=2859781 RepID=UPI0021562F27|nr:hemerythrin domain-containing protein [Clostridium weizhouense]
MININSFLRQHKEILEEVNHIDKIINKSDYIEHLNEFVTHINKLAGKLNVHLASEDKFLYPSLINGNDNNLKTLANLYMTEMGNISNTFTNYKDNHNTKNKINTNISGFVHETNMILKEIKKRISKEESELYKLI